MNRLVNILYAALCVVIYTYFVVYITGGETSGISSDAQFIGISIIIAGCLAYGGND